ncbi:uncharacterized protein LOC105831336 isoform X1 [Monomorium pharaonis]|uniref:uncharacterized protein LOC105831336 isoform X1 n=1 Tax=Monomorium pharaonis TaxID=307658 RepID=UPI00174630DB|nr:uncharacterized protein LOC105831336 isoform X1 [Monomorium pharaonis]
MDPNSLTVVELKGVLREMNCSTNGSKNELIERLKAADPSGAWMNKVRKGNPHDEQQHTQGAERLGDGNEAGGPNPTECTTILMRELEIRERERRLMERELEIVRRELDMMRSANLRDVSTPVVPSGSEEVEANSRPRVNINSVAELLPPFSGTDVDFDRWERQLRLLKATYALDDKATRLLIGSRLKGKALDWLFSKSEFLEMSLEQLLAEMKSMFRHKVSKMVLRKEFEKRIWKHGESFSEYLHDKVILANKVPVEEEDVVEYIIEGIPDTTLRDQARIQKLKSKESLLEAFEKITMRQKTGPNVPVIKKKSNNSIAKDDKASGTDDDKAARGVIRCYNCNSLGHLARNCRQPKREQGACFSCGAQGHISKNCKAAATQEKSETKEQVSNVEVMSSEGDNYIRNVKYELSNEPNCVSLELDSLFDTGSAVSFIKIKSVPHNIMRNAEGLSTRFCGINNSQLRILGAVRARMSCDGTTKDETTLLVVPNDTMKPTVILGRDALRSLGYTLQKRQDQLEACVEEILSIDVSDERDQPSHALNVNPELPITVQTEIREIYEKEYVRPERPEAPVVNAELKLELKEHQPFSVMPRRLSWTEKEVLRDLLDKLLKRKVIRVSESEYSSPIVLVKKKNGEHRMCIDYRVLNKYLLRSNYPMPLIEDQLDVLADKKYFTLLDLKDGFHHIKIAKESIKYTSFVTPLGQYECEKMPFGLKTAPLRFQKFINDVLREFIDSGDLVVYMDDFMIATSTIEHHLCVLRKVFRVLVNNLLELRIDKCKFVYTRVEYLGYIISEKGISPTKEGVEAILNFPVPKNVREVRGFVGLCSYFRKFIERFSLIAKPLYDLLKKDVAFEFKECQLRAFEELKAKLASTPILSIYNPRDSTELHCDASSHGFGAILFQKKQDLKLHPIFYYSKRTTETESRYHSFELETLAIVYALRRFRVYLHGVKFKIVTDCQSLKLTLDKRDINPRISRWALELQEFDYTVEHRKGTRMSHVDCLSRCYFVYVVEDNTLEFNLSVSQSQDASIKELQSKLEKTEDKLYEMRNGIVYRKKEGKLLFVVPSSMEASLLYKYHNELGHMGIDKVCEMINRNYWFPKIRSKVGTHIANCLKCIAYSPKSGKREGMLQAIPKEGRPFEVLHIDHFGPVVKDSPKKHVLVVVDAFTKFVKLYATKSTSSQEATNCLEQYFYNYSSPTTIISDRGRCFCSKEFDNFILDHDIKHIKVATASPQANGQAERVNRVIQPMLAKLVDSRDRKNWYKVLPQIEYALNNVPHKSTGDTPSHLLFGTNQRMKPADNVREYLESQSQNDTRDLDVIRNAAKMQICKAQEYNKTYVDKKRKKPHEYAEGDSVMVRNFESTPGTPHKLIPQFRGPYKVIKKLRNNRYVVADVDGHQVTQRPYQGVWEPANMRPWKRTDSETNHESEEDD